MKKKIKVFRVATVPVSLNLLLKGQLRYLNQHYDVTAISGDGPHLWEVRDREGVKIHPITLRRPVSLFHDLISLFRLYLYFKKEKPTIVHSLTPKAGLLSMTAAKLAGVPVRMHTFTGLIFPSREGYFQTLLIGMDRLLCTFATHLFPEGQGVKEDLQRYGITRKPLKVLANGNINGVDLAHFSAQQVSLAEQEALRRALGISTTDFVFIFVGRLVGDKGINELVHAFSKLSHQIFQKRNRAARLLDGSDDDGGGAQSGTLPKVKLLLVGPFEPELDALHRATSLAISGHPDIISVGFREDVRPYFTISHVFVLPSYREGFPNAVLQAGAMELPAIVTDINGCNEIVEEGRNGTLVPLKDTQGLHRAMERILSDSSWYRQLKSNARPMIESRYEQHVVWNALLEEYREILRAVGVEA